MIANCVPTVQHFFKDVRMFTHVITDTKKSRFRFSFLELIQYKFSWAGHGAIVESKKQFLLVGSYAPEQRGVKPGKKERRSE